MSEERESHPLTIEQALARHRTLNNETARLDVELILCHVLDCDRAYLRIWPDKLLNESQSLHFTDLLAQRSQGVPVAYLLGYREFWNLNLKVSEHTLIPRPDTEVLVETALTLDLPINAKVLDLGTGTGAIALSLANENAQWSVEGVDRFEEVISLATENAVRNQLDRVHFSVSNWFESIGQKRFDLIVSNPPYIEEQDPHLSQGDVRFEPKSALTSGSDGLDDIRRIVTESRAYFEDEGWLVLEHGYDQGEKVRDCLSHAGFCRVSTSKDYGGNDRVTMGQWKQNES